jgi:hypothetical protein
MHYHSLTRIISLLVNKNTKLNIFDRITIISGFNEYVLDTEIRLLELEQQVKKMNIEIQKINNNNIGFNLSNNVGNNVCNIQQNTKNQHNNNEIKKTIKI